MTNHNHEVIRGVMTPEIRNLFDAFINTELRRIEAALTEIAQNVAENARNVPEDWTDCWDCEVRVLDSHDLAYSFLCEEFHAALVKNL